MGTILTIKKRLSGCIDDCLFTYSFLGLVVSIGLSSLLWWYIPRYEQSQISTAYTQLSQHTENTIARIQVALAGYYDQVDRLIAHPSMIAQFKNNHIKTTDTVISQLVTTYCPAAKNLICVNEQGDILYAHRPLPAHYQHNMRTILGRSPLGASIQRTFMTLYRDISSLDNTTNEKSDTIWITLPFFQKGRLLGIVAMQIDIATISAIANDRTGLGSSGETLLGTLGTYNQLIGINQKRHTSDPYIRPNRLQPQEALPLYKACLGEKKAAIAFDYRKKKVVGSWQLVPQLEWGIITKCDYDEIMGTAKTLHYLHYTVLLCSLILLLLLGATSWYYFAGTTHNKKSYITRIFFLLSIGATALGILATVYLRWEQEKTSTAVLQAYIKKITEETKTTIEKAIDTMEQRCTSLIDDIQMKRVSMQHISDPITHILAEHSFFKSIYIATMDPKTDAVINEAYITTANDTIITDTRPSENMRNEWNNAARNGAQVWLMDARHEIGTYIQTRTFANETRIRMVIVYDYGPLKAAVHRMRIKNFAEGLLMTRQGKLILHAGSKPSPSTLRRLSHKGVGYYHYENNKHKKQQAYISTIVKPDWKLAFSYSKDARPRHKHNISFLNNILVVLNSCLLFAYIRKTYHKKNRTWVLYIIGCSCLFSLAALIWYIVTKHEKKTAAHTPAPITKKSNKIA